MSINQVLAATDELLKLLEEERAFMEARDLQNVYLLADHKSQLSEKYNHAVRELKANKLLLKQSPVELFDLIQSKTKKLKEAIKESEEKIELYNKINSKLLEAMIEKSTGIPKQIDQYTSLGRKTLKTPTEIPPLTVDKYI